VVNRFLKHSPTDTESQTCLIKRMMIIEYVTDLRLSSLYRYNYQPGGRLYCRFRSDARIVTKIVHDHFFARTCQFNAQNLDAV